MSLHKPRRWTARNAAAMNRAKSELMAAGSESVAVLHVPALDHHYLAVITVVDAMRPIIRAKKMTVRWDGLTTAKVVLHSYSQCGDDDKLRLRKDMVLVSAHSDQVQVKWWYRHHTGFGVQDSYFDLRDPDSVDRASECAVAHAASFQQTVGRLEAQNINARAREDAQPRFTPGFNSRKRRWKGCP